MNHYFNVSLWEDKKEKGAFLRNMSFRPKKRVGGTSVLKNEAKAVAVIAKGDYESHKPEVRGGIRGWFQKKDNNEEVGKLRKVSVERTEKSS